MLNTDIEKAKLRPEYDEIMPAVVGWKMDEPIELADTRSRRTAYEGAIPTSEVEMTTIKGPPRTKERVL